jgi:transcriptional regulator with XRE-family HTH domain
VSDILAAVSANIRRVRLMRGLSISELSRQSSVAKATLAQLELGRGNPTLETLMSLATHLGVALTELIGPGERAVVQVTRAGEGAVVRGDGLHVRLVDRLARGQDVYEIFDLTMSQGRYESPAHGPGVREHLMLHEGEIVAGPRDQAVRLAADDFVAFSADCPHFYECPVPRARATLMIFYPAAASPRYRAES